MKRNVVLWWIPAVAIAMLALAEGATRVNQPRQHAARVACATDELAMDLGGDGRLAKVHLTRVGDEAWADVSVDGSLKSSTRVGEWRDDATVSARDLNGDGRVDLVRSYADGGKRVAEVWLSNGTAFEDGGRVPSEAVCVAQR